MIAPRTGARGQGHRAHGQPALVGSALLAMLLGLAGTTGTVLGEEVLLSLPREFDVRPIGGWGQHGSGERQRLSREDLEREAGVFRFRGEQVTQTTTTTDRHGSPSCRVHITTDQEFQATFRRGELSGRWVSRQRNFYRDCHDRDDGEYLRSTVAGAATGQANADGLLKITVQVTESEIVDHKMAYVGQGNKGRWHYRDWEVRDQHHDPWSFGLEFQLPVGELQSSQELSTPPPPGASGVPPRAPRGVPPAEPPEGPRSSPPGRTLRRRQPCGAPAPGTSPGAQGGRRSHTPAAPGAT